MSMLGPSKEADSGGRPGKTTYGSHSNRNEEKPNIAYDGGARNDASPFAQPLGVSAPAIRRTGHRRLVHRLWVFMVLLLVLHMDARVDVSGTPGTAICSILPLHAFCFDRVPSRLHLAAEKETDNDSHPLDRSSIGFLAMSRSKRLYRAAVCPTVRVSARGVWHWENGSSVGILDYGGVYRALYPGTIISIPDEEAGA